MERLTLNLLDMHRCKTAMNADRALRISGGSPSCSYNRLDDASVSRLKRSSTTLTAKEWAAELGTSANTIRHRAKALGVKLKPFVR